MASRQMAAHALNWYCGWCLILSGLTTGSLLGLAFHRDDFWGGYQSFRRRIVRLGHIAQAALGMMNVVYGVSAWPAAGSWQADAAGVCFVAGGITMPVVCFLTGWKKPFRHLFFLPVGLLLLAVIFTLQGGPV